jgi:2',3'-cyclic-nucleotide 2'-phosphodiesterase (5'-nucleotidase family)
MRLQSIGTIASAVALVSACEGEHSCYGPLTDDVVLTRNVRRMQPDAQNATVGPRAPLEWGQINFLHTTDTHGWLEGHIKEQVRLFVPYYISSDAYFPLELRCRLG